MEFSKEIKQGKPFRNESTKAMLNTMYTAGVLRDRSIRLLKPHKINDQHYNILRILNGRQGKPVSLAEVKAVLIDSRGDLTRLIDKLVNMSLVERCPSDKDRRGVELWITDKGKALIDTIEVEYVSQKVHEFDLTNEEAKLLNTLLDKLRG